MEIQNKKADYTVRTNILAANNAGSMVARRLVWLLGKADLSNVRQILDIGSWHLNQSIEFSNIFTEAKIDAFEPVPDSFALCVSKRNQLDEQRKKRISIHNTALSNAKGEISLATSQGIMSTNNSY